MRSQLLTVVLGISSVSCGDTTAETPEQLALVQVKSFIEQNLTDLADASGRLQAAAPAADDDGWSATADLAAVEAMRSQWKRARTAYEHIEGAIAVLFPELDIATDERYDGFISANGPDDNLFDDHNVTGVHAIERILWADAIPRPVREFEAGVPGYEAAAFPATRQQADDFKTKLCARLVHDVATMHEQFAPLALDSAAAYRGVIGSLEEQLEKAEMAATGEEESRYAQYTLADMRTNVAAGLATFACFKPWLREQGGSVLEGRIDAGFGRLQAAYSRLEGDSLPTVPVTWSSQSPSTADLQTPFGQLWSVLHHEADAEATDSLVSDMLESAQSLGIPELPQ